MSNTSGGRTGIIKGWIIYAEQRTSKALGMSGCGGGNRSIFTLLSEKERQEADEFNMRLATP